MPSEQLCLVQFIHPGGEHGPDSDGIKHWNTGAHKRKFLRQPGQYLDEASSPKDAELLFWGEWEADSRVRRIERSAPGGPRFIHEAFLPSRFPDGWRQNTDPFVFGEQFHYTGCLQHTRRGPTQLRYLARGSVLLFGSGYERSRFVIDTVFVVDRWVDHSVGDYQALKDSVSETYWRATIEPWYSGSVPETRSHRLYFGATPEQPVNSMFSFFPSSTVERHTNGFARPEVRLPGYVTLTLTQGKRLNRGVTSTEVRAGWEEVVCQVRDQGLLLGVHAQLPS